MQPEGETPTRFLGLFEDEQLVLGHTGVRQGRGEGSRGTDHSGQSPLHGQQVGHRLKPGEGVGHAALFQETPWAILGDILGRPIWLIGAASCH